jgi:hypothetical protein
MLKRNQSSFCQAWLHRPWLLVMFLATLAACGGADIVFTKFVHERKQDIHHLQSGRVSCMHCPWYFRFETSDDVIAELLRKHELERVDRFPQHVEMLITLSIEDDWWLDARELPSVPKYFVEYRPKPNMPGESRIRLAMLKGRTVYWMTDGNFERQNYEKVPVAKESESDEIFSEVLKQSAKEAKKK